MNDRVHLDVLILYIKVLLFFFLTTTLCDKLHNLHVTDKETKGHRI